MTKNEFYSYIDNPETINKASFDNIEAIINQYPYFQSARLLRIKYLHVTDQEAFSQHLPKTALLCADRKRLFYAVRQQRFADFTHEKQNENKNLTTTLLDNFLTHKSSHSEKEPMILNKEYGVVSSDYIAYLDTMHSSEKSEKEQETPLLKHQSIIDRFLAQSDSEEKTTETPIEGKKDSQNNPEMIDNEPSDNLFLTETLAQIYIKQKKYEQALSIIRQLSLNFPKKSVYFADQIRFLEFLILNDKYKKL